MSVLNSFKEVFRFFKLIKPELFNKIRFKTTKYATKLTTSYL